VPDATIDDLDGEAIAKARENYKNKFPEKAKEVDAWDDITFLNKAKVTSKGRITRTAIILLGKSESEHLVSPADVKIRWILKDAKGNERDYHIESCPFLLAVDKIYAKIRNLKYRYMKEGTLFPDEMDQYEPFVIREAINNCIAHQDYTKGGRINVVEMEDQLIFTTLFPDEMDQYEPFVIREAINNCIAHQDYTKGGRINVVEMEDQLIFTNLGSFIPGSVEKVVREDAPEEHYRNKFLATAMFNLKMVDTVGGGIRKMFDYQRERFFPMPEYVLSEARVKVTVIGKVLDMEFAKVLARNPKLSLEQIIMLDKVQKKKVLSDTEIDHLRSKRLIEGRKPNFHVSSDVAARTNLQADYVKTRGLKDDHFKKLILEYLDKYKQASKEDIDKLLLDILPGVLDEQQRKNKIHNLVCAMSNKDKTIKNQGTNRYPKWVKLDKV